MTTPLHALADRWERSSAFAYQPLQYQRGYLDALQECAAELRAELAKGGWQTMESAPRDGTTIMMWHGRSGLRDRCVVGAFDAKAEHPWRFLDNPFRLTGLKHDGEGMCNAFLTEPTHWRPLPEPPR
jgi:hypothetical protein